jgi:hypothetical protein
MSGAVLEAGTHLSALINASNCTRSDLSCGVVRYFDELTDEREIPRTAGHGQRSIAALSGHEHAGDIGHSAGNAVGRFDALHIESSHSVCLGGAPTSNSALRMRTTVCAPHRDPTSSDSVACSDASDLSEVRGVSITACSTRSMYVRHRPDDSRRAIVQYSLIHQRRVTCTSVAAFLEPF